MAFHWVVKIVVMLACIVGLGVLGAGIGLPAAYFALEIDAVKSLCCSGGGGAYGGYLVFLVSMSVFGILGAAFGGYFGNKIIRSKFK